MSNMGDVLIQQVDALLCSLDAQREARCGEVSGRAEGEASALLAGARQRQRDRLRMAVREERKRRETALHQARQRIQTAGRQQIQARYDELLQRAWPLLVSALENRWSRTVDRHQWCDLLAHEAFSAMLAGTWSIEHPLDWRDDDTDRLTQLLGERGVTELSYRADPAIRAGLRIHCDGACLDGTTKGLLSKNTEVEALLLAVWEKQNE